MRLVRRVADRLLDFLLRVSNMNFGGAPFRDREDAGRRLAERLARYQSENPVIFALPRGGVPIGYEVAHALKTPLDVFIARKLVSRASSEHPTSQSLVSAPSLRTARSYSTSA